MSYEMRDDERSTINAKEMGNITKVAYRPEKNKDCLVIWQVIDDVVFERSYYYENYSDAKEDYNDIKDLFEMREKEEMLNEGW